MHFNQLSPVVLTGKILILIGIINCAIYPLIVLYWQQIITSAPMGSIGIQDPYLVSPYLILYIISSAGIALGITAFLTEDSRKSGKLAVLGGILAGNFINLICLPLIVLGGVLCYFGNGSQKP
ncbi:MAG: hypothetical protein WCX22_09665 [Methanoregula sp.]